MSTERDRSEWLARRFDDAYATHVTPDVAARHRARLAERARELADEAPPTPGRPRHLAPVVPLHRRATRKTIAAAAAMLMLLVVPVGVVVASGASAPGDTLYEVKRGQEAVRLATAASDTERGWTLVAQAERRLDELSRLSATERWEHAHPHVTEVLEALRAAEAVGDPAVSAAASGLRERGAEQVSEVAAAAPPATRERLEGSARVFTEQSESAPTAPWLDDDEGGDHQPHRSDRALAEGGEEADAADEDGDVGAGDADEGPALLEEPEPETATSETSTSTGSGRRTTGSSGSEDSDGDEATDEDDATEEGSTEDDDEVTEDDATEDDDATDDDAPSTEDDDATEDDAPSTEGDDATEDDDAPSTEDGDDTDDDAPSTEDGDVTDDDAPSTEDDGAAEDDAPSTEGDDATEDDDAADDDAPSTEDDDATDDDALPQSGTGLEAR